MTERKIFSCTPEMAREIEDLAHETRVKSDARVIRAAIAIAMRDKEKLVSEIKKAGK